MGGGTNVFLGDSFDDYSIVQRAGCYTELDKVVIHVISLVSFLCLWYSYCLPSDG